nr:putative tRNA (guanine(26)-N(2))-dimethyltransferase 2 [Ipomoea trifida]
MEKVQCNGHSKIEISSYGTLCNSNIAGGFDWVELIPSFNPGDHGVGEFDERGLLEERDDLFLPEYPLVLFSQVHKWVACLAVVDVWQPCLDSQPQMVTYHLCFHSIKGISIRI